MLTWGGLTFHEIDGGDGGTFAINPQDHAEIVFDDQEPNLWLTHDAGLHKHDIKDNEMVSQKGGYDWPTEITKRPPLLHTAVDGVFRSEDNGKTWIQISTDMAYHYDKQRKLKRKSNNEPDTLANFSKRTVNPFTKPSLQPIPGESGPFDPGYIDLNDKDKPTRYQAGRILSLAVSDDGNVVVASAKSGRRLYRGKRLSNGHWEWQLIILPDRIGGLGVQSDVASIELIKNTYAIGSGSQTGTSYHIYVLTQAGLDGWTNRSHILFIPEGASKDTDIIDLAPPGTSVTDLPDREIAFDLVADPWDPKIIYLATESGVYVCHRNEKAWRTLGGYLPRVPCFRLEIDPVAGLLRVGTWGRGIWEIPIKAGMDTPLSMLYLRDHLCDPGRGTSQRYLQDPSRPFPDYEFDKHKLALKLLYWWESPDIKIDSGQPDSREVSRMWSFGRGNHGRGTWATEQPLRNRLFPDREPDATSSLVTPLDGVTFDVELLHDQIPPPDNTIVTDFFTDVYVQVHNRGPEPLNNVIVRAFFAESTLGFQPVPADFWSRFDTVTGRVGMFQPIDKAIRINELEPSTPRVLRFHWRVPGSAINPGMILVLASTQAEKIGYALSQIQAPKEKIYTFEPFDPYHPIPTIPGLPEDPISLKSSPRYPFIQEIRETLLHRVIGNHRQIALKNVRVLEVERSKTRFIAQSIALVNHKSTDQDFDIELEPAEFYDTFRFFLFVPSSLRQPTTTLFGWTTTSDNPDWIANSPGYKRPKLSRIKLPGARSTPTVFRIKLPSSSMFSNLQYHGIEGKEVYKLNLIMYESDTQELVGGCTFEIRVR